MPNPPTYTHPASGMKLSLIGHIVALVGLMVVSFVGGFTGGCLRPTELEIPIEFTVDVTERDDTQPPTPDPVFEVPPPPPPIPDDPPPQVQDDPIPEPTPTPTTRPPATTTRPPPPTTTQPPPRPTRPEITKSTTQVTRIVGATTTRPVTTTRQSTQSPTSPGEKRLSPEEIAQLLGVGAKPDTHTSIPTADDARGFAIITNILEPEFRRFSPQQGSRPAVVTISLDRSGNITNRRLTTSSGSASLDDAALKATQAVRAIPNLPPGFTTRYPTLPVPFRLEH